MAPPVPADSQSRVHARRARLCLKARPTPRQLADRLRPVDGAFPDGLELYLDAADLADERTVDQVVERIAASALPSDFALLVEGPVGSLDGAFFDVTRESDADRLLVDRLAQVARRLGVKGVNIHLIAPGEDPGRLSLECRRALLERAVPLLRRFVDAVRAAGAVPTVENMPPVLRMRQGGIYFTPIGMAAEDLLWAVVRTPGLQILPDTSHAGLYLNARRLAARTSPSSTPSERAQAAAPPRGARRREGWDIPPDAPWLEPLLAFVRQLPGEPDDLLGYVQSLRPHVANAQVANAAGLLGEGLPYAEGALDLDPVVRWLSAEAHHLVAETLEPDPDDARHMRDALRRMRVALA